MAEQGKLILNNWSLGMSADEYSGGSFLYGENVNISRNSKSFRLADRVLSTDINNRGSNLIALVGPYQSDRIASFSTDGRIESNYIYNSTGGVLIGGAAYKRTTGGYLNAKKLGNYTIGVTSDKLDLFTGDLFSGLFTTTSNMILNPTLTTDTNWTVGAGRATGAGGATHTTGTTAMFSDDITVTEGKQYRISVEMNGCTTGSVEIYGFGGPNITLDNTDNGWIATSSVAATGTTIQVAFAPTNTFNGTIKYVSVLEYSGVEEDKVDITSHTRHPMYIEGGFIYIGSGNKVDIVETTTRTIYKTISLLEQDQDIFHIGQIGQSIVVLSTNGEDTKVAYRDGVSENANEILTYKDKVGTAAEIDGNIIYMICESNYKKELYIISGYDKVLVAKTIPNPYGFDYDNNAYAIISRNNFHNVSTYSNAMTFSGNKLIIPAYYGLYTYGYENPQQKNALVKERKLNTVSITSVANIGGLLYIAYNDVTSGVTKISYVREYNNIIGSGYVVTTPIIWDNFSTEKMIDKIKIGYIVPEPTSSIDIYVNADKYYFWTFYVSGLTTTPTIGATYTNYGSNVFEVVSTDISTGAGTITCRATTILYLDFSYGGALTKISGTGDASITYTDYDNFIKIKTIIADKYTHGNETIFAGSFVTAYMPDRHEIEIKVKITSTTVTGSPVIYDIPVLSSTPNNDV